MTQSSYPCERLGEVIMYDRSLPCIMAPPAMHWFEPIGGAFSPAEVLEWVQKLYGHSKRFPATETTISAGDWRRSNVVPVIPPKDDSLFMDSPPFLAPPNAPPVPLTP